jgi:hypothetical protein
MPRRCWATLVERLTDMDMDVPIPRAVLEVGNM